MTEDSVYLFDMDGTLTPARLPMTDEFSTVFKPWLQTHTAYIATGSDFKKVQEQIPEEIISCFSGVYCSMGNFLWSKGSVVYCNKFAEDPKLDAILDGYRKNTKYPYQLFDNYIEKRPGMINFSVLGRDWDKENHERLMIKEQLLKTFGEKYEVAVGGSISIDITPTGLGKGQVARKVRENYPQSTIVFFGDKTMLGGNDYELAQALRQMDDNTKVVQVEGPEEVCSVLKL